MTDITLTKTRIRAGIWEGVLTGVATGSAAMPKLRVTHGDAEVPGVSVTLLDGPPARHAVCVPIPAESLCEGVQTFVISDPASGAKLTHFTVITGVALEDDIRAEVDLLRAELDMLKRAFRRHCLETAG